MISGSSPLAAADPSPPRTTATRTAPMGPRHGMLDAINAALAPFTANTAGSSTPSLAITTHCTMVSFPNVFGNNGLVALSMTRIAKISRSFGAPSRRVNVDGIFPLAYDRSR